MKSKHQYRAVFVLMASTLILQTHCMLFTPDAKVPGRDEYYEIEKIPEADHLQRTETFNHYPVSKQIDIFLFAMVFRAPAQTVYREYLAMDGQRKLPELVTAIESTDSLNVKELLIGAIWHIDQDCTCVENIPRVFERLALAEPTSEPSDDRGDMLLKKNYRWFLFELQRKNPERRNDPQFQNPSNPHSNSFTNGVG